MPSWVVRLSPFEEIEKAKDKDGRIASPRMWMRRGLALICPRVENGKLIAGMAIIDDNAPFGEVEVFDVDTNESHVIYVPEGIQEAYLLDVRWSL
ncbi:hypothetical protein [Anabaena lutea]|uniref:YCII-related domain-containing protein n=1 Tax=Anabaena lutea FACHB-196 TaxID=2692881 RepID=A0ABR8FII7_9NOST|nr:hypothetical protein [Anabaena lutea]MBD2570050.1 hypothetical protein [Anabaena lutea FACHB-196]